MIENLFYNALYGLGFVIIVSIIFVVIVSTLDVLEKRRMKKEMDKFIQDKIKRGDFNVVGVCIPERMEDEENHS